MQLCIQPLVDFNITSKFLFVGFHQGGLLALIGFFGCTSFLRFWEHPQSEGFASFFNNRPCQINMGLLEIKGFGFHGFMLNRTMDKIRKYALILLLIFTSNFIELFWKCKQFFELLRFTFLSYIFCFNLLRLSI